jgi:hypothetical protein
MEKTFVGKKETLNAAAEQKVHKKLTFIFRKAEDKIMRIRLHQEVEKDIQKAKEKFDYGNFFG